MVTAHHEDCLPKETEDQKTYISPSASIEAKCTPKESKPSMIFPSEVQSEASKKVQFASVIQVEPHLVHDVKNLKEIQVCVQWPHPNLGQYFEDDTIYIYNPS